MIPLTLSISGFLSYRDPVELDFTGIDLACVSGANGAGKSSLLDAITWVLFGQARKRDDALVNSLSSSAQVGLVFSYENNLYRVQRVKPRDKTGTLEFQIWKEDDERLATDNDPRTTNHGQRKASGRSPVAGGASSGSWKPLTESSLRQTEARIQQTLRMDYDTFVNASFFLQGKADQFTQQRPSDRKRILSSILGLEAWEVYRQQASEQRRAVETEIEYLNGQLREISAELEQEKERKQRLHTLEGDLHRIMQLRQVQEDLLASARQADAALAEQARLVEALRRQAENARRQFELLQVRLESRQAERLEYAGITGRAAEIEAAYANWQAHRKELEAQEEIAQRFRQHEKRREAPRLEIQSARARLEQELYGLQEQQADSLALKTGIENLQPQIENLQSGLAEIAARLEQQKQLEAQLDEARQRQAEARAENPRLKAEMEELKERIDNLNATEGAECPLCGQPLEAAERDALIKRLEQQGKEMGDRYRTNQLLLRQSDEQVRGLEDQIQALAQAGVEHSEISQALAQFTSRAELMEAQWQTWEKNGAPRLEAILGQLAQETYAPEARGQLAQIDAELREIGYDAGAHDAMRSAEALGRASETEMRQLEKAQAALAPLEREIGELQEQVQNQQTESVRLEDEYEQAAASLAAARAAAPDLYRVESEMFNLKEQENRLHMEVGAARQRVDILDDLRTRRKSLEAQREELAQRVAQYKQLERAFGKDGVPALLIEQALPEIENRANEILDRLSAGSMTVRFVTQAAYKDKKRDDFRETLDIQISDSSGIRDYEMFSGGEAFRVNFAIRLALSKVLAQRAGARLQTLVIDEGFGSQDAQGRQRLIETINLVRSDFAKVLVITHIDELKDAFPYRIEVEKTDRGSTVRVV